MEFVPILRGLLGVLFITVLAVLVSSNRRAINWKLVGIGIVMQFAFAFLVLKTDAGRWLFSELSSLFVRFFTFASDGAAFVFGNLAKGPGAEGSLGFIFAFQVLPTIIFFASTMAVLYHFGVMQRVVQGMAWVMLRLLRTSGAESLCVAANTFMGQTEAPLVIRPYLARLTESELLTIMLSGMAHISGGVMAAYVAILGVAYATANSGDAAASQVFFAGHLLAACIMAAPATIVIAKIMRPETDEPETMGTVKVTIEKQHANAIDAAASGAGDGLRLALNVAGMLIAFIAIVALVNSLLNWFGGVTALIGFTQTQFGQPLSLELFFGLVFQFIAFAIGVPWNEAMQVGSLMGIKLVLNEFVAYLKMADAITAHQLSARSIVIATYALCGFANISSIAIQIGGIGPLAENRRGDIARLGIKAVLGGTLATWMTASVAGLFVN
jgi:CNT family concentrative nucleoside transporter